jgi:hypothetical protein
MGEKPCSILIIEKLAPCLKIPKSGLYKIVLEGKIPCQKRDQSRRMLRLRPAPFTGRDAILLPNQREKR